jgi:hypothetical protein
MIELAVAAGLATLMAAALLSALLALTLAHAGLAFTLPRAGLPLLRLLLGLVVVQLDRLADFFVVLPATLLLLAGLRLLLLLVPLKVLVVPHGELPPFSAAVPALSRDGRLRDRAF